jgi:threonine synthase
MWRFARVLPVQKTESIVSLGEGMTPLVRLRRIGSGNVLLKDEGLNPTGSMEARAFSCAVSMAVELGIHELSIAAMGNEASALAAYAAAGSLDTRMAMPEGASQADYLACKAHGVKISLIDESVSLASHESWRMEGMKTIGYEIAEQLDWDLPDVIVCYSGAVISAISKAFSEMEAVGWIGAKRPEMISTEGEFSYGERIDAGIRLAAEEGIFASPEGAAGYLRAESLLKTGGLKQNGRTVICNPASGLKYPEAYSTRFPRMATGETDKLGGLITPR